MAAPHAQGLSRPYFDNVTVNALDGALPPAAAALPGQGPIYPRRR